MRAVHLVREGSAYKPALVEVETPVPAASEVLVRIEAASLNYRDLLILDGATGTARDGFVPLSDGAGHIAAVGPGVAHRQVGELVAASFFRDWVSGRFEARYMASALGGGNAPGMLAECVVLPESAVVPAPAVLDAAQAATLPCAAVTAWQALFERGRIGAGDTLLVQGTGGVALFGLQFARAVGARVIVISSSDDKLARARALGAEITVNYKSTPEWDQAVLDATAGRGATHILELGGPGTFEHSLAALAPGGSIAQIGVLTGFGPRPNLMPLQSKNANITGITVGAAAHFAAMNAFIAERGIEPVIDRVFTLEEIAEAYAHLRSGAHFGKVVVRV